jgi:hypothetical protein
MKGMVLRLYARMFDHGTGVGLQSGHCAPNVTVNLNYLLDGRGFEEGRGNTFLNT